MPGNLTGPVAEKVVLGEQLPGLRYPLFRHGHFGEQFPRFFFCFKDQLLAIDRVLVTGEECPGGEFVQIVEQRGLP